MNLLLTTINTYSKTNRRVFHQDAASVVDSSVVLLTLKQ